MDFHFEWTVEMSVGEPMIDAQHIKLLGQLNTVIDAMVHGPTSIEVLDALTFFERYVSEHLTYEEAYMEKHAYSGIAHHKELHEDFRHRYAEFRSQLESGQKPVNVLIGMEGFLGRWFLDHIKHEDQKYHLEIGDAN